MNFKTYLIYILQLLGALLLIAPIICSIYKSMVISKYTALMSILKNVAKAVVLAGNDRGKNTDKNEED